MTTGELIIAVLLLLVLAGLALVYRKAGEGHDAEYGDSGELALLMESRLQEQQRALGEMLHRQQGELREQQDDLRADTGRIVRENMASFSGVIGNNTKSMADMQQQQLDRIDRHLQQKLDEMRGIVDEKLQRTLNERMTASFKLVNDRLEQVYKGLGDMQTLARSVGDLKKVMGNVKTRGILGEIQLGAILKDIMAPEQYEENVATRAGSRNVVEFAIKLPTARDTFVYLPIDAKFPGDTYAHLQDAYAAGDAEQIALWRKELVSRIRSEGKDIHDKYLDPPRTTDFAVLFLPFEGLYAEAVNLGLIEILQREYHVNLAGPSTMAALLNSIQMTFRNVAIQKQSLEVWRVLGAVKTEFAKFESALAAAQNRMNQANDELDKLVGVRTRVMQRRLKEVTELDESESLSVLYRGPEEDMEGGE